MAEPLKVTYRTPLDSELRAAMVAQLVKYLLFMRGQIPCLYDELFKFVATFQLQQQRGQEERPKKRRLPMSGGIKKALKCVEAAELLCGAQLDAVFALKVQRLALVFGSSLMSPREVVIVDFGGIEAEVVGGDSSPTSAAASPQTDQEEASQDDSQTQTLTPPSPPMTRDRLMRLCTQKLLRALFTQSMEHFSSALPTTKLHVAVLAECQPTRISGFIPKQQFKLRLPKDKRGSRTYYIEIYDGADNRKKAPQGVTREPTPEHMEFDSAGCAANEPTLTSGGVNQDMMWYVLEKPLPGFSEIIGTGDDK